MIHRFTFSALDLYKYMSLPARVDAFVAVAWIAGATRVSVRTDELSGSMIVDVEAPEPVLQRLGASSISTPEGTSRWIKT